MISTRQLQELRDWANTIHGGKLSPADVWPGLRALLADTEPAHSHGVLDALTFVPELGHATSCSNPIRHAPVPVRFVWHHVLPQTCGGLTEPSNLISLCDNCHYGVHAIMYRMRLQGGLIATTRTDSPKQRVFAARGYLAALAAGTVDRIPNEGGAGPS